MDKLLKWLMIPLLLAMCAALGSIYITVSKEFTWIGHILAIPIGFVMLVMFSIADQAGAALRQKWLNRKKK